MDGDDITYMNETMPSYPKGMPLWQRVMCLLGYHKKETRQTCKGHCYGFQTEGQSRFNAIELWSHGHQQGVKPWGGDDAVT